MAEFGIQPRAPLKECQFKAALEAGTKESEVQAYFERWIDAFQGEDGQTERRGCHVFLQSNPGAATIGSRKVDLTVYERPANGDVMRTELRIVTAGELKPRVKTTGATDDYLASRSSSSARCSDARVTRWASPPLWYRIRCATAARRTVSLCSNSLRTLYGVTGGG